MAVVHILKATGNAIAVMKTEIGVPKSLSERLGCQKIIPAHGGCVIVQKLFNGKEVGLFEPDTEKVRRIVQEKMKKRRKV